ncbi:MAG: tRNA (adenosine(37)-N6)-dimethylallyltransferase MiaA [Ignavibacteria bacterium]|nr:tRNA (adenosine(37)-N6)-dimethylallyltransferase MiaA [Ignavibacteria bacterium]
MNYNLITILGPTAIGKTRIAANLAYDTGGEIISADSRQVYRGMDIGTGKDIADYSVNGKFIKYHLIDICSPLEEFSLFDFRKYFNTAFKDISLRKKIPVLAGGTGLYLSSVLQNYKMAQVDFSSSRFQELHTRSENDLKYILNKLNPKLHNTTDLTDKARIVKAIMVKEAENESHPYKTSGINSFTFGITDDREIIRKNITERLKFRLKNGMIEEAEKLIESGVSYDKLMFFGLEYKYLAMYLKGEINYNDMFQKLNTSIHQFAKRQMTWFRKMEREGVKIHWFKNTDYDKILTLAKDNFNVF